MNFFFWFSLFTIYIYYYYLNIDCTDAHTIENHLLLSLCLFQVLKTMSCVSFFRPLFFWAILLLSQFVVIVFVNLAVSFYKTSYGENIVFLFFFGFDTLTYLSDLYCFNFILSDVVQVKEIMCNGQKNYQVFKKHWKEYHPEVQQIMCRVRWS